MPNPKTIKELTTQYDAQHERLRQGYDHFYALMIDGITVTNPVTGEQATLHNRDDHNDFFSGLHGADKGYPMTEIGRSDSAKYHMYIFLYSKGFTPNELEGLLLDPESEESKEVEARIKNVRQEYYDIALSKDAEKVSQMYADAYKTIQNVDVSWIKKADTPEKLIEVLPKMEVLGGGQSTWFQTNNLGGTMRPIDAQVVDGIRQKTQASNVDLNAVTDTMQYIHTLKQHVDSSYQSILPGDKAKDIFVMASSRKKMLSIISKSNQMLPDNATVSSLNSDPEISLQLTIQNANDLDGLAFEGGYNPDSPNEEYEAIFDDVMQGKEDAPIPWILYEAKDTSHELRQVRSVGKWASEESDLANTEPETWKKAMEEDYQNGEVMDGYSVLHSVRLAKEGKYDGLSGIPGDGERMLQVMEGDVSQWGALSTMAKAAAAGKLVLDHSTLFTGSVENMIKEADKLHMDMDHPLYMDTIDRYAKRADPHTVGKLGILKELQAERKLNKGLEAAAPESKRELARTLFLMQLAGAQSADPMKQDGNTPMKRLLSSGEVSIRLPKMDEPQMAGLLEAFPAGEKEAAGLSRRISYDIDPKGGSTLKLGMSGIPGKKQAASADLRGVSPENLMHMLSGLDEKLNGMGQEELDQAIQKLGGKSLGKEGMADFIRTLGKGADGLENGHAPQMGLAAKEVNPPFVLGQDEFMEVDRIYNNCEIEGERKYTAEVLPLEQFEKRLQEENIPEAKAYFTKFGKYYQEQARQMEMYADAAEKMHRILKENEKRDDPSGNIRTFAQEKEKELAEKYRIARQTCEKLASGIKDYEEESKGRGSAWVKHAVTNAGLYKEVQENAGKTGPSKDELDASMASNFTGIEFERTSENTLDQLSVHKWKLLGVKYKNSDRYQRIVDSMQALKEMRGQEADHQNIKAYQKEYEHLRDLCEDYIVTHKNPWRQDGKDRLRMVKDVWEGMSNVQGKDFDRVMDFLKPGQKIANVNFHQGERRKVSLQELEAREPMRKKRLKDVEEKRKAARARQRDAERAGGRRHGVDDIMENNRAMVRGR